MPIKSALPKPNPIKPPPMGGGYNKPYTPKYPGQAVPLQPPANPPKIIESDAYRQFLKEEPALPSINPKQDYGGALDPEQPRVLNKDDRARQDQEMYARLDEERKKQEMLDRVQPSPNPSYGQNNPPTQVDPNEPYLQEYDTERSQPNQTDPDVPDFNEYAMGRMPTTETVNLDREAIIDKTMFDRLDHEAAANKQEQVNPDYNENRAEPSSFDSSKPTSVENPIEPYSVRPIRRSRFPKINPYQNVEPVPPPL